MGVKDRVDGMKRVAVTGIGCVSPLGLDPVKRRATLLVLVRLGEAQGLVHEAVIAEAAPGQDVIDLDPIVIRGDQLGRNQRRTAPRQ